MTFLIDGYNLMHAVGLLGRRLAAGGLERARTRFLDWLADVGKDRSELLRVVFDAQEAVAASPESDHRGVRVLFAHRRTADDLIEELLAAETRPARVVVVSNDGRVREAGRRRGCVLHSCEEFVDWCISPHQVAAGADPPKADKPESPATPDEMAAWLAAFTASPKRKK